MRGHQGNPVHVTVQKMLVDAPSCSAVKSADANSLYVASCQHTPGHSYHTTMYCNDDMAVVAKFFGSLQVKHEKRRAARSTGATAGEQNPLYIPSLCSRPHTFQRVLVSNTLYQ